MELTRKYQKLLERLREAEGVLVAFSGGIDSSLLLKAALLANSRVLAVTGSSPLRPRRELAAACELVKELGAPHLVIETTELADPEFRQNPENRCYLCKKRLCTQLKAIAQEHGLELVADGSNVDDLGEYRPGMQALLESGVVSPLAEVGLAKREIRQLARELALPNWDKPSAPCLATRFPYHTALTSEALAQVENGEAALEELGFSQFRLRHHGTIARIEVPPAEFETLLAARERILAALKPLGYQFVTLDLEGFRSGCFDQRR